MNTCALRYRELLLGMAATVLVGLPAQADDTEVYLGVADTGKSKPNVLFVLDTSGSMGWDVDGHKPGDSDFSGPTRLGIVRDALIEVLNNANDINAGLMNFPTRYTFTQDDGDKETHLGSRVLYPLRDLNAAPFAIAGSAANAREELIGIVEGLTAANGTPALNALTEAAFYYRGEEVYYGIQNPTALSHPESWSGAPPAYKSPFQADAQCVTDHIVFLSDGEPNNTLKYQTNKTREIFDGTGYSCDHKSSGKDCAYALARFLATEDQKSGAGFADRQTVRTHAISFAIPEGESPYKFLDKLADEGQGGFYTADDVDELVAAFNAIVAAATGSSTFSSPGVTVSQVNRLANDNHVYFALFNPENRSSWGGNLKKYQIANNRIYGKGDPESAPPAVMETGEFSSAAGVRSFWSNADDKEKITAGGAAGKLSMPRYVYTDVSPAETGSNALTHPANRLSIEPGTDNSANLTKALFGITDNPASTADETSLRRAIRWANGYEVDGAGAGDSARKTYGDPLHSNPLLVNYKAGEAVRPVVFVTTNDGYLHAVNAGQVVDYDDAGSEDGSELWSWVPRQLLKNIPNLVDADDYVSSSHIYGLDGQMTIHTRDTDGDGLISHEAGDRAFLYVGMRRGGVNYYALDISNPAKPEIMFTLTGDKDQKAAAADFKGKTVFVKGLGQTWAKPVIGNIRWDGGERLVMVISGGYDSDQDNAGRKAFESTDAVGNDIFIIDAEGDQKGEVLWRASTDTDEDNGDAGAVKSNLVYSMPAQVTALDFTGSGLIERFYAIDIGGQVFRFDINNKTNGGLASGLVTGGRIADLRENLGDANGVANNRRFFNPVDVAFVRRPAGRTFAALAVGSGYRAHPIDMTIRDQFYVLRDPALMPGSFPKEFGRANLMDVTDRADEGAAITTEIEDDSDATDYYGWYIDLEASGEKALSSGLIFNNRVIFTSYKPDTGTDPCEPAVGKGRLYVMNIVNGEPLLVSDGVLEHGDRFHDDMGLGIPASPRLLFTPEPTLMIGTNVVCIGTNCEGNDDLFGDGLRKLRVVKWRETE